MVRFEATRHLAVTEKNINTNVPFKASLTGFNIAIGLYPKEWVPEPIDIEDYLELEVRKNSWKPAVIDGSFSFDGWYDFLPTTRCTKDIIDQSFNQMRPE